MNFHSPAGNGKVELLPETHNIEAVVPEVDLLFHSNPKDHIHREDPPEEVPAVFVFS